jgi:hypothetical protein
LCGPDLLELVDRASGLGFATLTPKDDLTIKYSITRRAAGYRENKTKYFLVCRYISKSYISKRLKWLII